MSVKSKVYINLMPAYFMIFLRSCVLSFSLFAFSSRRFSRRFSNPFPGQRIAPMCRLLVDTVAIIFGVDFFFVFILRWTTSHRVAAHSIIFFHFFHVFFSLLFVHLHSRRRFMPFHLFHCVLQYWGFGLLKTRNRKQQRRKKKFEKWIENRYMRRRHYGRRNEFILLSIFRFSTRH